MIKNYGHHFPTILEECRQIVSKRGKITGDKKYFIEHIRKSFINLKAPVIL